MPCSSCDNTYARDSSLQVPLQWSNNSDTRILQAHGLRSMLYQARGHLSCEPWRSGSPPANLSCYKCFLPCSHPRSAGQQLTGVVEKRGHGDVPLQVGFIVMAPWPGPTLSDTLPAVVQGSLPDVYQGFGLLTLNSALRFCDSSFGLWRSEGTMATCWST